MSCSATTRRRPSRRRRDGRTAMRGATFERALGGAYRPLLVVTIALIGACAKPLA